MEKRLKNYKAVLFPLGVVVVLIFLIIGVANFLLERINLVRGQMTDLRQKNEVLSSRLDTLQAYEGQISTGVNVASLAIPSQNPSILITSLLKKLASEREIAISKLSVFTVSAPPATPETPENTIEIYQITFETSSSSYQSLADFISSLSKTRPILKLETVAMDASSGDKIDAQLTLTAFSAPFPAELPALDEPLSGLSESERETLSTLESYTAPEILETNGEPTEVVPRDNPFSLNLQ